MTERRSIPRRVARRIRETIRPSVDPAEIPKRDIAKHVPPAPVVVEAGAHRGLDTLEISRHWPEGSVHAFEPVPELYAELLRRTQRQRNVRCYEAALAATSGVAQMNLSSADHAGGDQSSSLLAPKSHLEEWPSIRFDDQIAVRTTALDDWARDTGVARVDLLWLDLQGMELEALKGAEQLLRTASAVYTEATLTEQYEGGVLFHDLRAWLEARDFAVVDERLPHVFGGNVLFARASRRSA